MTDDERLKNFLKAAMPPSALEAPARDLWPLVARDRSTRPAWSWLDIGLAAAAALALLIFPRAWILFFYHV